MQGGAPALQNEPVAAPTRLQVAPARPPVNNTASMRKVLQSLIPSYDRLDGKDTNTIRAAVLQAAGLAGKRITGLNAHDGATLWRFLIGLRDASGNPLVPEDVRAAVSIGRNSKLTFSPELIDQVTALPADAVIAGMALWDWL